MRDRLSRQLTSQASNNGPVSIMSVEPSSICCVFAQLSKYDRWGGVEERVYRQSRLCRVLGNPIAFTIVNVLGESKELSPTEIAEAVGRSVSRVSHVLAALRLAEMVRYETDGRQADIA